MKRLFVTLSSLTVLLSTTAVFAHRDSTRIARIIGQSFEWGWHTDWTTSYYKTQADLDSTITVQYRDTSTYVWRTKPPQWMTKLTGRRYELGEGSVYGPVGFRRYYWTTAKPGAVVMADYHKPTRLHKYYRARVNRLLLDSTDYTIRFKSDSTFDIEGNIRHVILDSNSIHKSGDTVIWSHGRLEINHEGNAPWLVRFVESGNQAVYALDHTGREAITVHKRPEKRWSNVDEVPDGYRMKALDLLKVSDTGYSTVGKPLIYTQLEWITLPPAEFLQDLNTPLYIRDGNLLSSYIAIDSNTRSDIPKRDTVKRTFNAKGRLVSESSGSQTKQYVYDKYGDIIEESVSYYGQVHDRTLRSYVVAHDKRVLGVTETEIKSEFARRTRKDTTLSRRLWDLAYHEFDRFGRAIEAIASVKVHGNQLTVKIADDLTSRVSGQLIDIVGETLASTKNGVLAIKDLKPGYYRVIYALDGSKLYDQTISIDKD